MKTILLLFSISILMAGSCDDTATFEVGESFMLSPGDELSNKDADLTVSLVGITEDSRCPQGTNCVWEGQAKIELQLNDEIIELILRDGKPDEAQQLFNNSYIIEAQKLTPYPDGTAIDPATYSLQLLISSL